MTPGDLSHGTAAPPLTVFCPVAQDRPAVSHRPLLQLGSAWFSSALMVRPRPPTLRQASRSDSVLRLLSLFSSLAHQDGDAAFQPGGLRLGTGGAGRRHHAGTQAQVSGRRFPI